MTQTISPSFNPTINPLFPEAFRDFWEFVVERQNIYHRKHVLKRPAPWTSNPIFKDYFFTNVYRDLDRGTLYLIENVHERNLSDLDKLFNILVYRYFNNIETWEFFKKYFKTDYIPHGVWSGKRMAIELTKWEALGNRVFTDAFTVTGVRFGGFADKISNICWLAEQIQTQCPTLLKRLHKAKNLKDVFQEFTGLVGFGNFLSYEVTIDVNYPNGVVHFSEDDFVNPGPGCKRGIQYIFAPDNGTHYSYVKYIEYLRWNQREQLRALGLNFRKYNDKELSLRSIEHSLCEFQKYCRLLYHKNSDGSIARTGTRRYKGSRGPLPIMG